MFPLLVLLFLVVPILELYMIVQVAQGIGVVETLGLLIAVSLVGAWLVRSEGMSVLGKIQAQLAQGKMPGKQLVDGGLIMFAGALMLTPGFVTDAVGVLLLIPPTRIVVRQLLMKRFSGRMSTYTSAGPFGGAGFRTGRPFVVDIDGTEIVDLYRNEDPPDQPPSLS